MLWPGCTTAWSSVRMICNASQETRNALRRASCLGGPTSYSGDPSMRYVSSLLVLAGLFVGILTGCSNDKKKVEAPTNIPPVPVITKEKGKAPQATQIQK